MVCEIIRVRSEKSRIINDVIEADNFGKKRFEFLLHGFFESVNIQESLVKKSLFSPDENSDRNVIGENIVIHSFLCERFDD